jgi:iron complex outermembrane receptor protein
MRACFGCPLRPELLLALPVQAADDDALALPATAICQTQAAEPDLHTQVATGSRLNLTELETSASVTTVSAEQIQNRNNATVQQTITRTLGISFISSPKNEKGTDLFSLL